MRSFGHLILPRKALIEFATMIERLHPCLQYGDDYRAVPRSLSCILKCFLDCPLLVGRWTLTGLKHVHFQLKSRAVSACTERKNPIGCIEFQGSLCDQDVASDLLVGRCLPSQEAEAEDQFVLFTQSLQLLMDFEKS